MMRKNSDRELHGETEKRYCREPLKTPSAEGLPLVTNLLYFTGDRNVVFDDLSINEAGLDYTATVSCSSVNYEAGVISATSPPFSVHIYPKTGLLRKSDIVFTYRGPYQEVMSLVTGFDSSMGSISCTGCPAGSVGSRKKRETASGVNIMQALKKVHFPDCYGPGNCPDNE